MLVTVEADGTSIVKRHNFLHLVGFKFYLHLVCEDKNTIQHKKKLEPGLTLGP